jgi:hypothetical protein
MACKIHVDVKHTTYTGQARYTWTYNIQHTRGMQDTRGRTTYTGHAHAAYSIRVACGMQSTRGIQHATHRRWPRNVEHESDMFNSTLLFAQVKLNEARHTTAFALVPQHPGRSVLLHSIAFSCRTVVPSARDRTVLLASCTHRRPRPRTQPQQCQPLADGSLPLSCIVVWGLLSVCVLRVASYIYVACGASTQTRHGRPRRAELVPRRSHTLAAAARGARRG